MSELFPPTGVWSIVAGQRLFTVTVAGLSTILSPPGCTPPGVSSTVAHWLSTCHVDRLGADENPGPIRVTRLSVRERSIRGSARTALSVGGPYRLQKNGSSGRSGGGGGERHRARRTGRLGAPRAADGRLGRRAGALRARRGARGASGRPHPAAGHRRRAVACSARCCCPRTRSPTSSR